MCVWWTCDCVCVRACMCINKDCCTEDWRVMLCPLMDWCSVAKSCPTLCNRWTTACQASLSFTVSWELVMLSSHLILCHSVLLLPSIFPSIRVFSSESALHIRWPKYWSFNFSISPSNEYSGLISFRIVWFDLISWQSKGLSRAFSNTTVWKHQFFDAQPSLWSSSHIRTWLLEKP